MANQTPNPQASGSPKGAYGKRPLWQWILIYVLVGGIVYYAIYYFVLAGKGGYSSEDANYNYNYNSSTTNYNYNASTTNTGVSVNVNTEPPTPTNNGSY
jgi:hypothetical protein